MRLAGFFGAALAAMIAAHAHAQSPESGAAAAPAPSDVVIINPADPAAKGTPPAPAPSAAPEASQPAPGAGPATAEEGAVKGEGSPSPASPPEPAQPAAAPPEEPAEPTLTINIDLGAQRMTVYEDGEKRFHWAVSSARYGHHTPTGTFRPTWMTRMWYSRQYDYSPMPHAIFFHKGVAIHGSYAIRQLGQPASHGCVRLAPGNAAKLYALVGKHGKERTKIVVHGKPRHRAPMVAEYDEAPYGRRIPRGYGYGGYYFYEPPPYYDPPRRRRGYGYDRPRRYVERGRYRNYGYSWGF